MDHETHHCPLCGFEFVGADGCPTSCPMSTGCGMVKCPNCRYEYVVRSRTVDAIRSLLARWFPRSAAKDGTGKDTP